MAVALVAVEISVVVEDAAQASPPRRIPASPDLAELQAAFLSACSSAAAPAVCTAAAESGPLPEAVALTHVEWRGPGQARIEVAGTAAGAPRWVRTLDFLPGDAQEERWKAAGFAAGTLARELLGAERGGEQQAPAAEAAAPVETERAGAAPGTVPEAPDEPDAIDRDPDSGTPAPDTPPSASTRSSWLDAGAWGGRGLWRSTLRLGGVARFTRVFDGPLITASVGYTTDGPDGLGLSGTWLTPSVGAGYALPLSRRLTTSLRCEIVAERLAVTARDPATGRTDEASRWVGGARMGVDVAFIAVGPLGLVGGADVALRATETRLELSNEVIGALPAWDWGFSLGLRAALQ